METIFNLGWFLTLLILGYAFGRLAEKRHYRSIEEREEQCRKLPTCNWKTPLPMPGELQKAELVSGSIVVSIDYFKRFLAGLRNLFGGRVTSYETLLDRARREAILRMKERCPNASQIINVRVETASISQNTKKGSIGSVEIVAYGTALTYR
jgi:uncharacterized protein YbjQ (UPF0145 family)